MIIKRTTGIFRYNSIYIGELIMKEQRHSNPLVDTRRPRQNSCPGTNPPVFAWRALPDAKVWKLIVAKDSNLNGIVIEVENLDVPYYLSDKAFPAGKYFWSWSDDAGHKGETFSFEASPEAVVVEVPFADELFARMPPAHPRIWMSSENLEEFRSSRKSSRDDKWRKLEAAADKYVTQSHELAEPLFLPDYHTQHDAWFHGYNKYMIESRLFLGNAEILALAYLVSGDRRYARAACERMVSVAKWDPAGSTWIEHNDEPHMSIVNWGPTVCDWIWEHFTDDERKMIVEMFRRRGELAEKFIRSFGHYGSTHYGSHHGREIVFLGLICLVFHEHIPETRKWMEWLRPILCGIWPMWAGEDGAWAEGPHYSVAYVCVMTRFAAALRSSAGIDLFRRPFWPGYLQWLKHCCPPDVEWIGFGDGAKYRNKADNFTADVVRLLAHFTGSSGFEKYASMLGDGKELNVDRIDLSYPFPMMYIFSPEQAKSKVPTKGNDRNLHRVFHGAGWVALHTHLGETGKDVAFVFRSSPYGSVSHSHADNNDFALHVAGKSLLIPSGIYDGWATNHHSHWVWHTKSANCLTLSDAGQLMRSEEATGAIEDSYEDELLVYWRGNADASYQDRALRCKRHVVFLKPHQCFLMVDEFVARPKVLSAIQWNAHSCSEFAIDEKRMCFLVERDGSSAEGHFLWHAQGFFSVTDKADPPPIADGFDRIPFTEYNMRFTPWGLVEKGRNLGVILCPGHVGLRRAQVRTEFADGVELAYVGDDRISVYPESRAIGEKKSISVSEIILNGKQYLIGDGPVHVKS
jgi:hypothetical protein